MSTFKPCALPLLIGSLPHESHRDAVDLIFKYTAETPIWPQLPSNKSEGMLLQYLPGMPGVKVRDDKSFVDVLDEAFEAEFLSFFEDYLMASEEESITDESRFAMSPEEAGGFFEFLERARQNSAQLQFLKGHVTGPVTFCTGLVDQEGRALFYNEQLRDAAVKLLALKAGWQTRKMAEVKGSPIVFFDEPGLAGFGSSAFITITPEDIKNCLMEVFEPVRNAGGLVGVHVCANTEWSLIFDSGVDIVNFDAYSYFDRLVLYPDHIVSFFERGGVLASGIIPTSPEFIGMESTDSLVDKWTEQTAALEKIGVDRKTVFEQTLITPSCGLGTASEGEAERVLQLTREVSSRIRSQYS